MFSHHNATRVIYSCVALQHSNVVALYLYSYTSAYTYRLDIGAFTLLTLHVSSRVTSGILDYTDMHVNRVLLNTSLTLHVSVVKYAIAYT